ncbi:DUF2795 domain-containing protein [Caballeronia sp. INDeC2]|uniref:DUF2795 domain-containing protein n=1 Tax=Caballeronia sp. INDeC2 TaxID=2921747 RepID=UPI0020287629|nr:DUF2795 domain-containing protein [Caballeronia sp. INDeC2]
MAQHPAHSQYHRHPDEPPPQEIARALKGADYPMGKQKILALAKSNGADGEVMAVLNKMTDHTFDSTDAVLREAMRAE